MPAKQVAASSAPRQCAETCEPSSLIETERPDAGVVVLTLARPEARNSLSQAMLAELQRTIDAASADTSVRAVIIAGKGPAFCAGHDLRELTDHRADPDGGRAFTELLMRACASFMQSLVRCPKPV